MAFDEKKGNIAVYIDGDNANYKEFTEIYEEIKSYGRIIIGRIYGDWTKTEMKGWKDIAIKYAFEPVNCFSLRRKNSTDISLICDLMKDLYKNKQIDLFIIVSSDSDYTNVTTRIRSEGKMVIGIGRMNTPVMLKNSCDIFITTETVLNKKENMNEDSDSYDNMEDSSVRYETNDNTLNIIYKAFSGGYRIRISKLKKNMEKISNNILKNKKLNDLLTSKYKENFMIIEKKNHKYVLDITNVKSIVKSIFERSTKKEFNLSIIKDTLLLNDPSFDHRNYGFIKMSDFVNIVLHEEIEIINGSHGLVLVKERNN